MTLGSDNVNYMVLKLCGNSLLTCEIISFTKLNREGNLSQLFILTSCRNSLSWVATYLVIQVKLIIMFLSLHASQQQPSHTGKLSLLEIAKLFAVIFIIHLWSPLQLFILSNGSNFIVHIALRADRKVAEQYQPLFTYMMKNVVLKQACYSVQGYTFTCTRRGHKHCVRELCKCIFPLEIVGYLFQMTGSKVEQGNREHP